jgi:phosphatidylglycerol:prolipoprotein diacylglycerol transferase
VTIVTAASGHSLRVPVIERNSVITINLDPVLIHVGPIAISWYGLAVMLAVTAGVWLTLREAKRKGLPTDVVGDLAIWVVLGGIAGARILHVIDRWDIYAANPLEILAFHHGGLAIQGAILGGALAGGLVAWKQNLPVRKLFDAAAPGIVLGQAIGRLGCLVTGDALGPATDGTWGIVYLNPGAMAPHLGVAYQPVFFYELLWDLAIFLIVWPLRKRLASDGRLFAVYLGLYAVGKFSLTFLRTETIWFWGLQEAQFLAIAALVAAIIWASWGQSGRRVSRQNA